MPRDRKGDPDLRYRYQPQSDGKIIRITFPQLTEDRRKELAKEISKMAEESKVAVRNIRREAMDKLKLKKKGGELTEDDLKQAEKKDAGSHR